MAILEDDGNQIERRGLNEEQASGGGFSGGGGGTLPVSQPIRPSEPPVPVLPTWRNGLTGGTEVGDPPENWVQGGDGAWFPPVVVPPRLPLIPREPRIIPIPIVPPVLIAPDPIIPPPPPVLILPDEPPPPEPEPIFIDETPPPPTIVRPPDTTLQILVRINVQRTPDPVETTLQVAVTVFPPIPKFDALTTNWQSDLFITPIPLKLELAIGNVLNALLAGKVAAYFDTSRELHTLINFGSDYQALITDWRYDPADISGSTMLVKMYQPLPDSIDLQTPLWVVRELAPPVIDRLYTKFTPPPPEKIFLRPPNRNIQLTGTSGASVQNKTMKTLFTTGSFDIVRPSDPALESWFTDDFNSAELNISYADYRQFVSFGSARGRIEAFANKLLTLEDYDRIISFNSASLIDSGKNITGSANYPAIQSIANKRIDLLRSFDAYERFLYYETGIPYSSSINTDDYQDAFLYTPDCTWPKISGSVIPVASASTWMESQFAIADEYDQQNPNWLVNTIPQYLKNDDRSQEFVTFLNLIGHQFDGVKIYIDHMSRIYDRSNDPTKGISQDLVWSIAQAFGIDLPNQYAVKNLVDYTIGQDNGQKVYRKIATETWKRFMHNQIFMMKSKGTKTSLRALANSYGILPTLLQIREAATPGVAYPTQSFEFYEEQTNVLNIPSGSWLEIPWAASSSLSSSTVELRFSATNVSSSVLLNASNKWALRTIPTSGTFGYVALVSASVASVSSSVLPIYSGDFYSVMVQYATSGMTLSVKRAEKDAIIEDSTTVELTPRVASIWYTPQVLYVGGSGSVFGQPFTGLIDEFRMWGEKLTTATYDLHVKYPGLYNGNTHTSARDFLYVRYSFNKPKDLGAASVVYLNNEAPSHQAQAFRAVNFPHRTSFPYNMDVILREVVRYSPNAGGSQFTTNKVIIADPPKLKLLGGVPVLSPKNSIVSLQDKALQGQPRNTIGFYFSLTDAINDNIIRTFGNIDLQDFLGDPADEFNPTYVDLDALAELYWTDYAYTFNTNSFIDFVRNLLDPMFKQAKQLVPARAKLLSGIVHEPHILERSKVTFSPVEVSAGQLTRRHQTDTYNLEANPLTSQPETDAGWLQIDSLIPVAATIIPIGDIANIDGVIDNMAFLVPQGDFENLESAIAVHDDVLVVQSDFSMLDAEITEFDPTTVLGFEYVTLDDATNFAAFKRNQLFDFGVSDITQLNGAQQSSYKQAVQSFRSLMTININDDYLVPARKRMQDTIADDLVIATIEPFTNFNNIESYTYFSSRVYAVPKTTFVRVGQNIQTDRGAWTFGSTYTRNDVITLSGSLEFVCVTTNGNFHSFTDPSRDTSNWRQATYTPVIVADIRKAVVISGSVSIVPSSSLLPVAVGYRPEHYKNTRDMRQGIIRHQWLGCLQTQDTTPDGKPPIEVFFAPGSSIIVSNPGEPVQPTNNQSGPILDVQ